MRFSAKNMQKNIPIIAAEKHSSHFDLRIRKSADPVPDFLSKQGKSFFCAAAGEDYYHDASSFVPASIHIRKGG